MASPSQYIIPQNKKNIINSILTKIEKGKDKKGFRTISFDTFFDLLDSDDQPVIKEFLTIPVVDFGFKGKFYGIQEVPKDLVEITNQTYKIHGKTKKIDTQYLPEAAFSAYTKLNQALFNDEKKHLLVLSGYRSSAYQMFVFLWYLQFYKFDFGKTIKRAAIPGYSEHSFPQRQAIDFMNEEGSPTDENPPGFAKTIEYEWLHNNAGTFGFYETNPPNNKLGTMYEPWHWAYII